MKAAFLDNRLHVEGEMGSNPTLESVGGANLQEVRVMYELNAEKGLHIVGFSENSPTQGQIGSQSTQAWPSLAQVVQLDLAMATAQDGRQSAQRGGLHVFISVHKAEVLLVLEPAIDEPALGHLGVAEHPERDVAGKEDPSDVMAQRRQP